MNEIKEYTEKMFENFKHIDENGFEYWFARKLQKVLEYTQWRRFERNWERAEKSYNKKNCDNNINDKLKNVE